MPHSGGGGSHSGGSHGSSSHGSHSSYSSSSGGSKVYRGAKNVYYNGASRYMFLSNGKPRYFYSDFDYSKKAKNRTTLVTVIIFALFLIVICFALSQRIHVPVKLHTNNEIIVQDNLDITSSELVSAFEEYKEKTGITPAIYTGYDSEWIPYYTSMENYAYELYINMIPDETYLLIVYTVDENNEDWHYELMLGDDTDHILTNNEAQKLNEKLCANLMRKRNTFSDAIANALKESAESSMKISLEEGSITLIVAFLIFVLVGIFAIIIPLKQFNPKVEGYNGEKIEKVDFKEPLEFQSQITCPYCGTSFSLNTDIKCPNCGVEVTNGDI